MFQRSTKSVTPAEICAFTDRFRSAMMVRKLLVRCPSCQWYRYFRPFDKLPFDRYSMCTTLNDSYRSPQHLLVAEDEMNAWIAYRGKLAQVG